jgi:hypothetical protein
MNRYLISLFAFMLSSPTLALQEEGADDPEHQPLSSDLPVDSIPDLREEDTKLKFQGKKERNLFVTISILCLLGLPDKQTHVLVAHFSVPSRD